VGALAAVVTGLFVKGVPMPLHLLLMFAAGFLGGAIWGLIPAILRVKFKTNILITTLLMNFIAIWLIYYEVRFPLKSETSFNPITEFIEPTARLPILLPGTTLHAGILISLGLAVVVWFILQKSILGYRIKAIGANPDASQYSGMPVKKVIITSMILSGGLAGLAGMAQVSGIHYMLADLISANYGFLGIAVAFIGRLNPIGAVIMSIFLGALLTGGYFIQISLGIDVTIIHVLVALIMLALVLEPFMEERLERLLLHT